MRQKRIWLSPQNLDASSSVRGNFDLVYKNDKGEILVVEAKGGVSPSLGKKQIGDEDYQQGTTEYFAGTNQEMAQRKAKTGDSADKISRIEGDNKAAEAIMDAAEDGKEIKYLLIETQLTNEPSTALKQVKAKEFDFDPRAVLD